MKTTIYIYTIMFGVMSSVWADDPSDSFDVMYVYTTAAKEKAGGKNAIESQIRSSIDWINQSFINSKMNLQVNLVHMEEVYYPLDYNGIDDSNAYYTAYSHLIDPNDGYMDNIHGLRDKYSADFVQLVIANKAIGGLAGVTTLNNEAAFSVIKQANMKYYAVHEIGHNFGINHGTGPGTYNYSNGYSNGTFKTIHGDNPGSLINYWSSPLVSYNGMLTGSNDKDARRTILKNAHRLANFRKRPVTTAPIRPNTLYMYTITNNSAKLRFYDYATNESGFKVYTTSGKLLKTLPAKSGKGYVYTTLSGLSANTGYNIYVVAYNSAGISTRSYTRYFKTKTATAVKKSTFTSPTYNSSVYGGKSVTFKWSNNGTDSKHRLTIDTYVNGRHRYIYNGYVYGNSKTIQLPVNISKFLYANVTSYRNGKDIGYSQLRLQPKTTIPTFKKAEIISPSYNSKVKAGSYINIKWKKYGGDSRNKLVIIQGNKWLYNEYLYGKTNKYFKLPTTTGGLDIWVYSYDKGKYKGYDYHRLNVVH